MDLRQHSIVCTERLSNSDHVNILLLINSYNAEIFFINHGDLRDFFNLVSLYLSWSVLSASFECYGSIF